LKLLAKAYQIKTNQSINQSINPSIHAIHEAKIFHEHLALMSSV